MQRIIVLSFMLAATAPVAAALATSGDAPSGAPAPLSAPLPATPEACAGAPTVSGEDLRFVTLFGVIDWEGRATQVEVAEPSDDCLKKAGVEAVRRWRFEPAEPDEYGYPGRHFGMTLIYPAEGPPRIEMRGDNQAIKRYPPRYPERCFPNAGPAEMVAVTYDVTAEGETENAETIFSSNDCLDSSVVRAVKRWRYEPRMIEGRAYPRTGMYTEITLELADGRAQFRATTTQFISIANTLKRKLDPRIALEKIAMFERQFGEELLDSEKALLLRYRGSAKIDAMDYAGALEDLRAALAVEEDKEMAANLQNTITQLEAALAPPDETDTENAPEGEEG